MWREGQTSQTATVENMYMMDVSPAFFSTMGIPVQFGRVFSDHDTAKAPKVAMVNEAAARKLWPDGNVVGKRIGGSFERSSEFEIIGIVRDSKYESVRDPGPPTMYRSVWQGTSRSQNVVLRTAGDPMAMSEPVRAAMREVDPTLPIQSTLDGADPHLDVDATRVVDERALVVDLVVGDENTLGERLAAVLRAEGEQHVHPRLLEVGEVDDVVDVAVGIHVGPAHRAAEGVPGHGAQPARWVTGRSASSGQWCRA
jgi:hypothetical protein